VWSDSTVGVEPRPPATDPRSVTALLAIDELTDDGYVHLPDRNRPHPATHQDPEPRLASPWLIASWHRSVVAHPDYHSG
jgi:hypothetical protein